MTAFPAVLGIALGLAACSPYGVGTTTTPRIPAFGPAEPEVATVCVIRSSPWARAVTFVVHDNQQLVGATRGPSYFCYVAAPGAHQLVSDTFDSVDKVGRLDLTVAAGNRYWVYQDHANHFGSVASKLSTVDEGRARELLVGCSYMIVTEVPGHEHVPPGVPFAPAVAMR